ncbi:diguanylate cyclase/phosphodiesterase, PAS, PAS and PAS domain-containing [Syntrophotalea carbinolica DSM 2380]|uniref:Diguanylate cyclase/phosphodiesterase, PAS, PAS and PAS domain-containing n=1 Tax=Syntrophotalea carbinolica (strain DSM 2380 / NBRC 103641 / GraBd1) TaxID=338963 RepID=Q3A017_SYNC1|nr:bifunctional diguanylate cyclase/phosphodiesterase [Syntrophotalea carbinolica]ABA90290.1 diguanylate cyclase/phosphodiesterase, PAS, PAS and PAS domain-containing [Syntrophotalea carbinolica DSM 2380]
MSDSPAKKSLRPEEPAPHTSQVPTGSFECPICARDFAGSGVSEGTFQETGALHLAFMESSIDGIVIMDGASGGVVEANAAFAEMLGYSMEELRRLHVWDWDAQWSKDELRLIIANTGFSNQRFETRHRRKDGQILDVEISATKIQWLDKLFVFCVVKDISQQKLQQQRLQQELTLWQLLMERSKGGIAVIDGETLKVLDVNPAFAEMLGYEPGEMLGMHPWEWDACRSRAQIESRAFSSQVSYEEYFFETIMKRKDGTLRNVEVNSLPMMVGDRKHVFCLCRDITERCEANKALLAREQDFRSLAENAPDAIVRYDRQLRRLYINPVLERLLGQDKATLLGKPFENHAPVDMTAYQDALEKTFQTGLQQVTEVQYPLPDGTLGWFHARFEPEFAEDATVKSVMGIVRDITELVEQRELAQHLAFTDMLTGLPNRALFEKRFKEAAAEAKSTDCPFALLMLDLDHFKDVNDSLGHNCGDELLRQVTARLSHCVNECDTIARMGGDEFAILLAESRGSDEAGQVADLILSTLAQPFFIESQELFISGSIGIAFFPHDSANLDELFTYADTAMYSAKHKGRNNFQCYDQELTRHVSAKLSLGASLRYACVNHELQLYYQPKVQLKDGRVVGVEALLRWWHPVLGMLTPDRFISIAEETGLIVEIGEWVLKTACQAAVDFNRNATAPFKVAVNLSCRQFLQNDLAATIEAILKTTGCRGEWLECEITESLMIEDNPQVAKTLEALRSLGITIAIDDFGTGYSALNYLSRFPIDVLKIDRSFINHIDTDPCKVGLVKVFIALGTNLEMQIVAEGVETVSESASLQKLGCGLAQGYLFGKPQPFKALMATLSL